MSYSLRKRIVKEIDELSGRISLSANENVLSPFAQQLLGSDYYARYLLGRPEERGEDPATSFGSLILANLPALTTLELLAHRKMQLMLSSQYIETRYLSGVHAIFSTILALSDVGSLIMSLPSIAGGHFATLNICNLLSRKHAFIPWSIKNQQIDFVALKQLLLGDSARLFILDSGAPLFPLDIAMLRESISLESIIVYDASHTLGLISGSVWRSPLDEGADILQGNTHKSFPGPQKAVLATNRRDLFEQINYTLSNALVSSQHSNVSAALFWSILEMSVYSEAYADKMIYTSQVFAETLIEHGCHLVSVRGSFTQSHILLIKFSSPHLAMQSVSSLIGFGIPCNYRHVMGHPCIRVGVQEITRRGISESNTKILAKVAASIITGQNTPDDSKLFSDIIPSLQEIIFSLETFEVEND